MLLWTKIVGWNYNFIKLWYKEIVVVAVVVGIIVLFLLIHIYIDIRIAYVHYKAVKTKGIVISCEGEKIVKNYGKFQFRKYWKYKIKYHTPEGEFEEIIPISKSNLKEGDVIDVKYTVNKLGTFLLDEVAVNRIVEFAIALILGLGLSFFIMMLES